jgi:hypothetical protein
MSVRDRRRENRQGHPVDVIPVVVGGAFAVASLEVGSDYKTFRSVEVSRGGLVAPCDLCDRYVQLLAIKVTNIWCDKPCHVVTLGQQPVPCIT